MVSDRAVVHQHPGRDLPVGEPLGGRLGDPELLGGESGPAGSCRTPDCTATPSSRTARARSGAAPRRAKADAGWLGGAGPGPSDPDGGSGGPENDATHRSIAFTTDTLMHLAAMIRGALGLPARGDRRTGGDGGTRPGHTDPAHR
ncbi:hypothetical protein GCM10009772_39760 [Pseudonocardia alni subsp. carboxydivorans]|uniref:Uncharacterized protein n=1 Tax=Pseudonocardia alni subsp. carboxydivorans TaxID=415010 RepID=A0ABU9AKB8_PSEA5